MKSIQSPQAFAVVRWADAHGADVEISVNELAGHHRPWIMYSYGFVLRSDAAGITIASEWDGDSGYRNSTFIPRGMVLEEAVLRLTRIRHPKTKEMTG